MRSLSFQKYILACVILFAVGAFVLTPAFVSAQQQNFTNPLNINFNPLDPNLTGAAKEAELAKQQTELHKRVVNVLFGFLGIVTFLVFLWGGFQWMTAQGNAEKVDQGKNTIVWGVLGLAVIALSYPIVFFLLDSLVRPFTSRERTTPPAAVEAETEESPAPSEEGAASQESTGCCIALQAQPQWGGLRCKDNITSKDCSLPDGQYYGFAAGVGCAFFPDDCRQFNDCCVYKSNTDTGVYSCQMRSNDGTASGRQQACNVNIPDGHALDRYGNDCSGYDICTNVTQPPDDPLNTTGGASTSDPSGCCITYPGTPQGLGWLSLGSIPPSCRTVTQSQCDDDSIFVESPAGCQSVQLRSAPDPFPLGTSVLTTSINDVCNPTSNKPPPPPGCCYWYPNWPNKDAKECRQMLDQDHCQDKGGKEFLKGEACPKERTGPSGCRPHDL